jgi:Domain of unknown function (DUF4249)
MKNQNILLFVVALTVGCKKPYNPKVISLSNSYLVVEGTINTNDVTTIKLSKTVKLSSSVTTSPVTDAVVTVENDNGGNYILNESTGGIYTLTGTILDDTRKFRLRIKTADNKEYLSDYEQAKGAPPIDSIGYKIAGKSLQLYANTHDPNNNTRYYRFDYAETWEFHSKYDSNYITNGTAIVLRTPDQKVYYCFGNNISSTIVLGSTAKLTQNVLYQLPITAIDATSEKLEIKYSILLHEYALSADAYKFWGNLKKNTEQLGSIFDAEPSQINGNIHNTKDVNEPVIGYISVGAVQSKRIFISSEQLPQSFTTIYPFDCDLQSEYFFDPISHQDEVARLLIPGVYIPVDFISGGAGIIGYTASSRDCVDCTTRGSKQQPAFWQ